MQIHIRFSEIILLCSLVLCCATQSSSQEPGDIFAFVKVNVVPMDSERVELNQTVIVSDGRIEKIGPSSQIGIPKGAIVIDGLGRYILPGLADMHVHLDSEDPNGLLLFVANGVTTVRNMWGNPEILQWRKNIEDGNLLGPTIYTTGPIIDGDPPTWQGSTVITTPEQAVKEVEAEKQLGYYGVKVLDNLLPEVYEAILRTAKEEGLPVYGHVPWRVGLEDALVGGQKSFEHMTDWMHALLPEESPARSALLEILKGEKPMNLQSYMVQPFKNADVSRIPEFVKRAATADVWFCPTLIVSRNFACSADEFQALRKLKSMQYVAPTNWEYWDMVEAGFTSAQGDPEGMKEGFNTMLISVKALHDAGVGLLIGTDTPNPFVVPGFSVHEELQNFVDAGLTPYEALRCATHDAAYFLGALEEFGTVAVGRRAGLILVEANPLKNIKNVSKLKGVMVGGRWFTEDDLRAMLDKVAKVYREE